MGRIKQQHLKQRKDGRYACRYKDQWFFGYTEQEALQAREDYKASVRANPDPGMEDITVGAYASNYLPIHKASVAKNTYNAYVGYVNHLIRKLGLRPMCEITPSDIKNLYNDYLDASESTIRKVRMIYVDIWDCAIEDGVVKSNPCRSKAAKPHKGTSGTHRQLTPEEDQLILTLDHPMRSAVLAMRYAGLRRGEAMALSIKKDVNFREHELHVRTAVHFEGNKGIEGDPKTAAGVRTIPLLSILEAELKDKIGLLAPARSGKMMSSSAWRSAWDSYVTAAETALNGCHKRWYGLRSQDQIRNPDRYIQVLRLKREADELEKKGKVAFAMEKRKEAEDLRLTGWKNFTVRPHDLRHSYCTMLRDAGVDMKLAIKWMGHEDEKMILRIYDHITQTRIDTAIKNLESVIA